MLEVWNPKYPHLFAIVSSAIIGGFGVIYLVFMFYMLLTVPVTSKDLIRSTFVSITSVIIFFGSAYLLSLWSEITEKIELTEEEWNKIERGE